MSGTVFSQKDNIQVQKDSSYLFKFFDETSLMGKVISVSDSAYVVQTKSLGNVTVVKSSIKNAELLNTENMVMGQYWFKNPNATRYLFSPSAIPLKKGEGYYQNTYLVLNSFYAGVTNNIAVGAGIEFISTFSGYPVFFATVKASGKIAEQFYGGGGIIWANAPYYDDNRDRISFGAVYGTFTFGNLNNNISVNTGFGYDQKNGMGEHPIVSMSGMARLSRKTFFITENWFVPITSYRNRSYYAVFSYGLRFSGEKISVDLALINSKDIAEELVVGFPFVGFAVKF